MGNQIFTQCPHSFTHNPNQLTLKPNIQSLNKNSSQKLIGNRSGNKQTYKKKKIQFSNYLPVKSKNIEQIYMNLINKKPIKNSIQNIDFLQHKYGVNSLKCLSKLIIQSQHNPAHDSQRQHSYSSTISNSLSLQQPYHSSPTFNIIKYKFQPIYSIITQQKQQQSLQILFNSKKIIYESYKRQSFQRNSYQIDSKDYSQEYYEIEKNVEVDDEIYQNVFNIVNSNNEYVYVGYVENGVPHGKGQLYCVNTIENNSINNNNNNTNINNNINSTQSLKFIQGQFINGFIQSQECLIIHDNGNFYRGQFHQNYFHGRGLLKLSNGFQLQGTFRQGIIQGKGKATYIDGGIFQGYFNNGKRQGKGKIVWRQNNKSNRNNEVVKEIFFEGYFQNDKINGLGYLRTPNYQYWGPFINNMKQGKGTIRFKDGKKFQGWFEKDQICGYGELHYPDGNVEKGNFPINKIQK